MRRAAALLLTLSCGEAPPSPSRLNSPRVLAMLTETPEVRPGGAADLQVVWFDPQGREAAFRWWWCWERAGVDPLRCERSSADVVLDGRDQTARIDVGAVAPAGAGTSVIVRVELSLGADRIDAFRRIVVKREGELHRPPVLSALRLEQGGVSIEVHGAEPVVVSPGPLCVIVRPEVSGGAGPATSSFFATAGELSPARAVGDGELRACWTVAPAWESARFWVVLRDERGGVRARSFELRRAR